MNSHRLSMLTDLNVEESIKGTAPVGLTQRVVQQPGHRERLRRAFIEGQPTALGEEAVLELLLTYAIPQKDVKPLAQRLLKEFGGLNGVLSADFATLCQFCGLREYSATLLRLVDRIRTCHGVRDNKESRPPTPHSLPLFGEASAEESVPPHEIRKGRNRAIVLQRRTGGMFSPSALAHVIEVVPELPEKGSLVSDKEFLKQNLHFNSEGTRVRYAGYVLKRAGLGRPDGACFRLFARHYAGRQEWRDVAFYRFCGSEPLMREFVVDVLLPSISAGRVQRQEIRGYLMRRFGEKKLISDCAQAIVETLFSAGLGRKEGIGVLFGYRELLLPAFAFVLHGEFPDPGMYDIAQIETNPAIKAMLWNPDRLVPALYDLRNDGLLSKVSQIDTVRQFTTRYNPDEVVRRLTGGAG